VRDRESQRVYYFVSIYQEEERGTMCIFRDLVGVSAIDCSRSIPPEEKKKKDSLCSVTAAENHQSSSCLSWLIYICKIFYKHAADLRSSLAFLLQQSQLLFQVLIGIEGV
jgi:hypothetical protein